MAWALTPAMMGIMSAKTKFYLRLAASAVFALGAVVYAVESKWLGVGIFGTAAVVFLIMAFRRRTTA